VSGEAPSVVVPIEVATARLVLRQWRDEDRDPYAAMNQDSEVMRYFPGLQGRETSDKSIDTWSREIAERGWSNWAVALRSTGEFIGFTGLTVPWRNYAFTPCVEIGWRLAQAHWKQGYATEAAQAALQVGFERLGLEEIVSFTALPNMPSRAVMKRLGMANANEDFDHPALAEGHELRRHCLYRLKRADWREAQEKRSAE
jgi:RimJ/RimL family protein N-acetyltransferase